MLIKAIPNGDRFRWRFVPMSGNSFEANGRDAAELEAWARGQVVVTTERAACQPSHRPWNRRYISTASLVPAEAAS